MSKWRSKLAYYLVEVANQLVRPPKRELKYNYWPKFRPIDQQIKQRGSYRPDHEYTCGAYSWEHLKSLLLNKMANMAQVLKTLLSRLLALMAG